MRTSSARMVWLLGAALFAVPPVAAQPEDLARAAAGAVNQLGFGLWAQQPKNENVFFSPYSIHQALGMLYLGARGTTRTQLAAALGASGDDVIDQAAVRALAAALMPRETQDGQPFTFVSSNGVFTQEGFALLPSYLANIAETFTGAELQTLDFKTNAEGARQHINGWIGENTAQAIPELIPEDVLNELTRLVLANAVYFKASWQSPFSEEFTADGEFTKAVGGTVTVPFMRQTERMLYGETPYFQAAVLPYAGGQVSAVVVLPAAGQLETIESLLTPDLLAEGLAEARPARVQLSLPRFEIKPRLDLKKDLQALGVTAAFDSLSADLSGIDGEKDLYVTDALHQAFVKVNEAGTEAAAATAVVVGVRSAFEPPVKMTVDRPFLFLLRDNATGALLFIGRVVDPTA